MVQTLRDKALDIIGANRIDDLQHAGLVVVDQAALRLLLDQVGQRAHCRGCGREVWWIEMKSGKKAPITAEALNHFIDCPKAADFKRPRG